MIDDDLEKQVSTDSTDILVALVKYVCLSLCGKAPCKLSTKAVRQMSRSLLQALPPTPI